MQSSNPGLLTFSPLQYDGEGDRPFLLLEVGDVVSGDEGRGPGYWCNQIRFVLYDHPGAQLTAEELEEWLGEILETSDVFDELVAVPGLADAQELMCGPGGYTTAEAKLIRQLLALWFNINAEYLDPDVTLEELCSMMPLPDDAVTSVTISDVLLAAEAALVSDDADDAELLHLKDIVEFLNHSYAASEEGCVVEEVQELRRRALQRTYH